MKLFGGSNKSMIDCMLRYFASANTPPGDIPSSIINSPLLRKFMIGRKYLFVFIIITSTLYYFYSHYYYYYVHIINSLLQLLFTNCLQHEVD